MKTRTSQDPESDDSDLLPSSVQRDLAFQLALCYRLGFGTIRDTLRSDQYLIRSGKNSEERTLALDRIRQSDRGYHRGTLYRAMRQTGRLNSIQYGEYYQEQNALLLATPVLEQDVGALVEEFEDDCNIVTLAKSILSSVYLTAGKLGDASRLDREVVNTNIRLKGSHHPDSLNSTINLANTLRLAGEWQEAEDFLIQAKVLAESNLEEGHAIRNFSTLNLAQVYRAQGKRHESVKLLKDIVNANVTIFGPEHPQTLTSKANLASAYRELHLLPLAEDLQHQALEDCTRALGSEHPLWLTSKSNLALIYLDQRNDVEAEKEFSDVMEKSLRIFGTHHSDALTSMANMVSTYQQQGRWKESRAKGAEVVRLKTKVLGPTHPSTLRSRSRLATSLCYMGQYENAEKLQRKTVDAWQSRKVENEQEHPDLMKAMVGFATILHWRDNSHEAEMLLRQVLNWRNDRFGPHHPETIVTRANLAAVVLKQDHFKEAIALYEEALTQSKVTHGDTHKETLHTASNLGSVYRSDGQLHKAEAILKEVISVRENKPEVFQRDHVDYVTTVVNLGRTYEDQGRLDDAESQFMQAAERLGKMDLGKNQLPAVAQEHLKRVQMRS
jgi:tetratricopeptide (TPR) repeat protein